MFSGLWKETFVVVIDLKSLEKHLLLQFSPSFYQGLYVFSCDPRFCFLFFLVVFHH